MPWYFQFCNADRSENRGCPFPRRPPTALRILYPARSRGRSRLAPQADARSSQVWCPSHTASPGCTLWCAPVPANGRTLTAAAANCRSFRCHTESVRPTSRRYCPLDPTALCGFTQLNSCPSPCGRPGRAWATGTAGNPPLPGHRSAEAAAVNGPRGPYWRCGKRSIRGGS